MRHFQIGGNRIAEELKAPTVPLVSFCRTVHFAPPKVRVDEGEDRIPKGISDRAGLAAPTESEVPEHDEIILCTQFACKS